MNKVRIAKKIAESGIASRREAERLIESGRVKVDGAVITSPVFFVDDSNSIYVDDEIGLVSGGRYDDLIEKIGGVKICCNG